MAKRSSKAAPPARGNVREALLTRRELAAALGNKHPMTVTKWEQAGMPVEKRGGRGRATLYRESAVRAWLAEREAASAASPAFADSRARKELAQALEAEQRVAMRARTLLAVEDVKETWAKHIAAARTVLLGMATTHADRVFRAATVDKLPGVEAVLREIAEDVLRELAGRPEAGSGA